MTTLRTILHRLFQAGALAMLAVLFIGAAFSHTASLGSQPLTQNLWEQASSASSDFFISWKMGARQRSGMEQVESLLMSERAVSASA